MNEITKPGPAMANPFARNELAEHANVGTIAIESERAIAEAQGKLVIAKRFPRSEAVAFQKVMDACSRRSLADVANWKFPRGGKQMTGPSIRLAEELARCWGNLDYGIRELSRKEGVSEMEAYCWDMETNTISSQKFTVRHIRDKSDGGGVLTSERDVYEITANMGARRLRSRILAILPPDLVEAALAQCRRTLAGDSAEPLADRVKRAVMSFSKIGVTAAMIEKYLGHSLDQTLPEELADLTEIRNAIRDGQAVASDYFGGDSPALTGPAAEPPAQATPSPANQNEPPAQAAGRSRRQRTEQPPAPSGAQPQASPGDQNPDPAPAADPVAAGIAGGLGVPAADVQRDLNAAPALADVFGKPAGNAEPGDVF